MLVSNSQHKIEIITIQMPFAMENWANHIWVDCY